MGSPMQFAISIGMENELGEEEGRGIRVAPTVIQASS